MLSCKGPADPFDAKVTYSTIEGAHNLELKVVIEGMETAAQLDFLREGRCARCRGTSLVRPPPAVHFERFLAARPAGKAAGYPRALAMADVSSDFDRSTCAGAHFAFAPVQMQRR